MYVGLFVRDMCERSVKNQVSKLNKWISRLAHDKQPVRRPHVEHMTGR